MKWSKDMTLKLIEQLQVNASLWDSSLCISRKKQKRKEELRAISDTLGVTVSDILNKVNDLRAQYNREMVKELRAEEQGERFVSRWYAYECLHFLRDSSKPYRVLQSEKSAEVNESSPTQPNTAACKHRLSPLNNSARLDKLHSTVEPKVVYRTSPRDRDEFSVFGEYIANELRSLKGEKNLLIAKKKIQDVIFEVKMGMMEPKFESTSSTIHSQNNSTGVYSEPTFESTSSTIHTQNNSTGVYSEPTFESTSSTIHSQNNSTGVYSEPTFESTSSTIHTQNISTGVYSGKLYLPLASSTPVSSTATIEPLCSTHPTPTTGI